MYACTHNIYIHTYVFIIFVNRLKQLNSDQEKVRIILTNNIAL